MRTLSVKDALKIQGEHLKDWRKLLKRKVYLDLERYTINSNIGKTDGYKINRGNDLSIYVANYTYNKKRNKHG